MEHQYPEEYYELTKELQRLYEYYELTKELQRLYEDYELTKELQRLYEDDTQNKERLIKEGRDKLDEELDILLEVVDWMDDTALLGRAFKRFLRKLLQNLKKINNQTSK